jgi:hypothetical protein
VREGVPFGLEEGPLFLFTMSDLFEIKEHTVEAQHIREYPRATANSQEDVLRLSVKQYIPKSNPHPIPGDVTIIAAHANGFVKVSCLDPIRPHTLDEC